MSLFDFLLETRPYAERLVDNFKDGSGLVIDTTAVNDAKYPFETAVKHPRYNNGEWIIVQGYPTKNEAQLGHNKWIKKMTNPKLPKKLTDCAHDNIGHFINELGGESMQIHPLIEDN